ncbi:MAG: TonB-dependent receptor [Pseudomonadota bacterium]
MKKTALLSASALCGLIATGGLIAAPAIAQETDEAETEQLAFPPVNVTATKRDANLKDVPVSVSAVSDENLDLFGGAGDDIQFLSARVPSLIIESSFGRIFPRPYIRGLGNTDFDFNASQPVSFIYDEVVFENPVLKGFPVFDLEQVEVLRGPQGTLFGRNTPAGIVKFDSVKPQNERQAYVNLTYGRFNAFQAEAAYNEAIVEDVLAVRVSALYQQRNNFVDNVFTGEDDAAGGFDDFAYRGQVLFTPIPELNVLVNVHGRELTGGQVVFQANAFETGSNEPRPGFNRLETFADAQPFSELETDTFGSTVKIYGEIGDFAEYTYVYGYESAEAFSRGDVDGGFGAAFLGDGNFGPGFIPFPAETADSIDNLDQATHEFRINNKGDERFDWTIGIYSFDEELTIGSFNFDTLGGGLPDGEATQTQNTNSFAIFGSASFEVTDQFTIAGGLRWNEDERDFVGERTIGLFGSGDAGALAPIFVQVGDDDLSWDVSATYEVTEDVNVFARVARGFRAPSIQGRLLFGDVVTTADSETVTSYEVGTKGTAFQDRVRFSLTGYFYEIDDQQLTAIGGAGNFNQLLNADRGLGYGFEAELDVLIAEGLTLLTSVSYNETEIDDPDLTSGICGSPCTVLDPIDPVTGGALIDGNPFPNAPEWIANAVLNYERDIGPGTAFASTDWSYRSEANIFLYESVEFLSDGFVEGGVRAGYRFNNIEVAAFGRNITDSIGTLTAIDFNNLSGVFNQPRTWGIELNWVY